MTNQSLQRSPDRVVPPQPTRTQKVANILLDGRFGGPQSRVLQVAERLKAYGVETVVIIPQKDSDYFYARLLERGIRVRRLDLHHLTRQKAGFLAWMVHFIPQVWLLRRCLKEEGVQVVHSNNTSQVEGVIAGRLAGARVIWHLNDSSTPWPVRASFRLLGHLPHGFVVTGHRVKRYYLDGTTLATKPTAVIEPPVDTRRFDPSRVEEEPTIAQLPGIKVGTVNNITLGKGLEYFIEMARTLSERHQNLHFFIMGPHFRNAEGYYRRLTRLASRYHLENFSFFGHSDRVPEVLKATDIFVCPSTSESGPMVVWEAMAMGKAIVSTDVGDVARYIRDGESGFIVPVGDVAALVERVGTLVENPAMRSRFGSAAREVAVRELDLAVAAQKHQAFYQLIAGGASQETPPSGPVLSDRETHPGVQTEVKRQRRLADMPSGNNGAARPRVAVVGCGFIAGFKYLPMLGKHLKGRADLCAVCDRNEDLVGKAAATFGIRGAYTDFSELLRVERPDIVFICTPTSTHAPLTIEALQAGAHVLSEKPMARNPAECQAMIDAAAATGRKLGLMHNQLFNPAFQRAMELVASGRVGRFLGMRILMMDSIYDYTSNKNHWAHRLPGGMTAEAAPHALYLSLALLKNVQDVEVRMKKHLPQYPWSVAEDVRFDLIGENGISSVTLNYATNQTAFELDIIGSEGFLKVDLQSRILTSHNRLQPGRGIPARSVVRSVLGDACQTTIGFVRNGIRYTFTKGLDGHYIALQQFLTHIQTGADYPANGEQGKVGTALMETIEQRIQESAQLARSAAP